VGFIDACKNGETFESIARKTKARSMNPLSDTETAAVEACPAASQSTQPCAAASPVFELKRILVPVDFSDCSKQSLKYGLSFAKQFDAELKLLHVVETYPAVPEMGPVDVEALKDSRAGLETLRQSICGAVRCSASLRIGVAHEVIAEAARDFNIDLIILATHCRTGLQRMFRGSTTEKIVRHAPCPILVVREAEREFVAD
jgi:universal stress protein A